MVERLFVLHKNKMSKVKNTLHSRKKKELRIESSDETDDNNNNLRKPSKKRRCKPNNNQLKADENNNIDYKKGCNETSNANSNTSNNSLLNYKTSYNLSDLPDSLNKQGSSNNPSNNKSKRNRKTHSEIKTSSSKSQNKAIPKIRKPKIPKLYRRRHVSNSPENENSSDVDDPIGIDCSSFEYESFYNESSSSAPESDGDEFLMYAVKGKRSEQILLPRKLKKVSTIIYINMPYDIII